VNSLGLSGKRWTTVYASTGTINTSDKRLKTEIYDISEKEILVAKELKKLLKKFKFKDAVINKKDNARWHFGIIAQDVKNTFLENELNPNEYGLFCEDELWIDSNGVYYNSNIDEHNNEIENLKKTTLLGIRYDELLVFIVSTL